jgi:hypothetical protein
MDIDITYGVGYGRHKDTIEAEDDADDEWIEKMVEEVVLERLDWSWKRAE